jgi:PhnB protein
MTKNSKIPENYQTVMPYLIVNGAEKFIGFMKEVFNGEETYKAMRDEHIIMHAEIMIGGSTIMFADSTETYGVRNAGMFIYVDDADATFKKAIDAGATVVTKMADQSYGRSGGVRDPFGNTWWITGIGK